MTVTDTEHSKSTNNYQITEQDEKSAPQYENETRFNIHVEEHGLPLLMMLNGGFGFGQKFEGMHPFFSIF